MTPLTRTQADRVMDFIIQYKAQHDGNSPTMREIGQAIDIPSTSRIRCLLKVLVSDGLIKLDERHNRSIRVVGAFWRSPWPRAQPRGQGDPSTL